MLGGRSHHGVDGDQRGVVPARGQFFARDPLRLRQTSWTETADAGLGDIGREVPGLGYPIDFNQVTGMQVKPVGIRIYPYAAGCILDEQVAHFPIVVGDYRAKVDGVAAIGLFGRKAPDVADARQNRRMRLGVRRANAERRQGQNRNDDRGPPGGPSYINLGH